MASPVVQRAVTLAVQRPKHPAGTLLPGEYAGGQLAEAARRASRPYPGEMSGAASGWSRWASTTARDVVGALVLTAVTVGGSYGEAHPNQLSDQVVNGVHAPAVAPAAFALVAIASLVLAGRRRYPPAVLALSTAAAPAYTPPGYVNGPPPLSPAFRPDPRPPP